MPYLYAAAPLVHKPVQSDLKELIVPEGPVGHHYPVVELIKGPLPLSCPVVIEQLYQAAVSFMESKQNIVIWTGKRWWDEIFHLILLLLYPDVCAPSPPWMSPDAEAMAMPD